MKLIEGEVKFSTGSRGMQHDFSFHHRTDRVNNTTSYGYTKYANAFGEWSSYVAKTKYAFSVEKINHLIDYYLDGIFPQQVYGIYPDISVKNRSITHKATFTPRPVLEIERLMQSTDYRKDELQEIIELRLGQKQASKSFAKFFWQTEHFVFQRPNYYTTVRMFSLRNRNMEVPYNGPGKPTHHRADGTNYLQLKGDEYHNIWPVYDWQKISGTTIVQKPELYPPDEIQKDGFTDFVGAVTDGLYGAVAFDFLSPHDFVKAKKSWFFFDDEYVCLGAGIQANRNLPVATTINQVLMQSEVTIFQNGEKKILSKGNRELENVKWVFQDKVAYVFPNATTINLSNQTESGRWSDITDQKNISTELLEKDVFALWYKHGEQPKGESYEYIVIPAVSLSEVEKTVKSNCGVQILSNTKDVQAVKSNKLNMVQIAFYKAGKLDIGNGQVIKMSSQGMAMLKQKNGKITEITVADPSRKLSQLVLTIPGNYKLNSDNCTVVANNNMTTFLIDLPQDVYAGKSVTLNL
jgi:chondroitin AC lyase